MPASAPSFPIRLANRGDLSRLLALEETCFQTDRVSARSFRRWLSNARNLLFVAEGRAELLGYALLLLHPSGRVARVYSLAVAPLARGGGVAARLMVALEHAAQSSGYALLRLEVATDNHAAIALYEKLGYRVFGRREHYYEDGRDALRMQKPLPGPLSDDPAIPGAGQTRP